MHPVAFAHVAERLPIEISAREGAGCGVCNSICDKAYEMFLEALFRAYCKNKR